MDGQLDGGNPAHPSEPREDRRGEGVGEQYGAQGIGGTFVGETDPTNHLGLVRAPSGRHRGMHSEVNSAGDEKAYALLQSVAFNALVQGRHARWRKGDLMVVARRVGQVA